MVGDKEFWEAVVFVSGLVLVACITGISMVISMMPPKPSRR